MTGQTTAVPVQSALVDAASRFDALLRQVRDPGANAIGKWDVAETVAHMAVVSYFDAMTCSSDVRVPPVLDELLDRVANARVADLDELNPRSIELFAERDLPTLMEHISSNIGVVALTATADPDRIGSWLGGAPLAMRGVAAHYLGELIVHGYDIARSQGLPWDIPQHEARLAFEACYMPVLQALSDTMSSPRHKPVSVAFRVPGEQSYEIDITPGRITIEAGSAESADVVFTSDAVTLVLMMFNRINPFVAVATGRVKLGGRRPWRAQRFRRQLRMP